MSDRFTKEAYRTYLTEHKEKNYPAAPASTQEYIDWWEEAVTNDLKQFEATGGHAMHFKPYQKDGPLLVLNAEGKVPEKYLKRFDAYVAYGRDMGLNVTVDWTKARDGGIVYWIGVERNG